MAAYEPDAEAAKAVPSGTKYLAGCQRPGDFGFIAEQNGEIIGAAWARHSGSPRYSPAPRLWLDNIWRAGFPPAPQPLGSGRRNDRRRRWRMMLARNRKFADSPLEETVRSELVSEMGYRRRQN